MALLLFSNKCQHSADVLKILDKQPAVRSMINLHDVSIHGLPRQLKGRVHSVPTVITKQGEIKVGKEVSTWIYSLIPPPEISQCPLGSGMCGMAGFGDSEEVEDNLFELNSYGQSLQPHMTPELQDRISRNVTDAFSQNS